MEFRTLAFVPLCMLLSVAAAGAPISGNLQAYFVVASSDCIIDEEGTTWTGGCFGEPVRNFEGNLALQLTVSGLEIAGTTVYTPSTVEFQMITVIGTIGALTVKDTSIFAPSITAIEYVLTQDTLTLQYCVNSSAPQTVSPPLQPCPAPDRRLYRIIEDVGLFHPAYSDLIRARFYASIGMLEAPVNFRTKIVDLRLDITGLTLGSRTLVSDLGTASVPSWRTGLIVSVEGQSDSGFLMRAEGFIGARQGLQCFGQCTSAERIYGGIVVPTFTLQEGKFFIRNLIFLGVTSNIRAEFRFYPESNAGCANLGLCYTEINSRTGIKVLPLELSLSNILRVGPDVVPRFDYLLTKLRFGDISVSAHWHFFWLSNPSQLRTQFVELISTFDPSGFTISSHMTFCASLAFVPYPPCVLKHQVYLSSILMGFQLDIQATFLDLNHAFNDLWADLSWKVLGLEFTTSLIFVKDHVGVLALRIKLGL